MQETATSIEHAKKSVTTRLQTNGSFPNRMIDGRASCVATRKVIVGELCVGVGVVQDDIEGAGRALRVDGAWTGWVVRSRLLGFRRGLKWFEFGSVPTVYPACRDADVCVKKHRKNMEY